MSTWPQWLRALVGCRHAHTIRERRFVDGVKTPVLHFVCEACGHARPVNHSSPGFTYRPGLDAKYDFDQAVRARKAAEARDAVRQRAAAGPKTRKRRATVTPFRKAAGQ